MRNGMPILFTPFARPLSSRDDRSRDLGAVSEAIEHRYDLDAFKRVIYTESHDEVANGRARVPEEIWPGKADSWFSKKRSTLGGALGSYLARYPDDF